MEQEMTTTATAPTFDSRANGPIDGVRKAAMLCVALGEDFAREILRHLDEKDQEQLSLAIAQEGAVRREVGEQIVREFNTLMLADDAFAMGGIDYARKVLEKTVGPTKAEEMIRRIQREMNEDGLKRLRKVDPEQLRTILRNEHPQTIALIMAHLDPQQCSAILDGIEPDLAADVLFRIAKMEKVSPDTLRIIENALGGLALNMSTQMSAAGGPAHVAEVLNHTHSSLEKDLLEKISERRPELAQEIKSLMFVFEDIIKLDDRAIQKIVGKVDTKDLATALKVASEELTSKILANMSQRAGDNLREEQEMLGPVRVRDVDAAQARIITVIRQLEEEGEVVISTGGEGDELV